MPLIEWSEGFETGIGSLDFEHRQMVEMLNEFAEAVLPTGPSEQVAIFLGEVYAKIQAHFALEERIMREHRFAGFAAHKADHERLLDELRDIMERQEADRAYDAPGALASRLQSWFMVHFHEQDAKLHGLMP